MPKIRESSVAQDEISHFSSQAGDWWNPSGSFASLHKINPLRLTYIRDQICTYYSLPEDQASPFKGLSVLDIGSGGGLLSEPLTRMGAQVTGVDASSDSVAVARQHASDMGLKINYRVDSAEMLVQRKERFDVVLALEILEHVADVPFFVKSLAELLKPGGLLIASTLNRTTKSFLMGIVAAEYILRWVPRGTHQWKKFVQPSELMKYAEAYGLDVIDICGLGFSPREGCFTLRRGDASVNYFFTAVKL